jgi:hypothetical protein
VNATSRALVCTAALVAGAVSLPACLNLEDFPDATLIDSPRVLGIVAEPPEVNPGDPVALTPVIAHAEDVRIAWRACGVFDAFFGGGSQYGEGDEDEGCGGGRGISLGDGERAVLDGDATQKFFDDLELAALILGDALPRDTVELVRTAVGMPYLIEGTFDMDGKHIRARKRVLVSRRGTPHTNPPPPRFMLGETEIVPSDGDPLTCAAANGKTPVVGRDREVELAPIVEGAEEPWLERYPVIDVRGALLERDERAYYSWFATGGELDQGVTKAPLRNEIWRAPVESGCHTLWVVVRDGHGGTSTCRLDVAVGDKAACE